MSETFSPDERERRIHRIAAVLTLAGSAAGLIGGAGFAAGILAGALLALVNYGIISRLVHGLARPEPRRGSRLALVGFALRYVLLGAVLYAIFAVWRVNVVAVSLGVSIPVAAIFVEWVLETYEEFSSERRPPPGTPNGSAGGDL